MPIFEIPPGETKSVINEGDETQYYAQLFGAPLDMGTTEWAAANDGQRRVAGDEGDLDAGGTELWVYNPADETAELRLLRNDPQHDEGVAFDRRPRDTIAGVLGDDGSASAPRSDDFVERQNKQVPVEANGSVVEEFTVPARADFLNLAIDDADGTHEAEVAFADADGNEIVTFDRTHSSDYVGDPANDDYVVVATRVFGTRVRVDITDTSGATNRLDYSIYGR